MDGLGDYHIKVKEVRQRKIHGIIYMQNLKYDTEERVYETKSHREETCVYKAGRGWEKDGLEVWG